MLREKRVYHENVTGVTNTSAQFEIPKIKELVMPTPKLENVITVADDSADKARFSQSPANCASCNGGNQPA